jgi:hypothetical protein
MPQKNAKTWHFLINIRPVRNGFMMVTGIAGKNVQLYTGRAARKFTPRASGITWKELLPWTATVKCF